MVYFIFDFLRFFTKKTFVNLALIFCVFNCIVAQNEFDVLFSYPEDTSVLGLSFQEVENGDFLILGNVQEYFDVPGEIQIEGPYTYGSNILRIDSEGEVIWNELFQTNAELNWDINANARTPSDIFLQFSPGEIILPYSYYLGYVLCDPNTAALSFKRRLLKLNSITGGLETSNFFLPDTICNIKHRIIGTKKINDEEFLNLYIESNTNKIILEYLNGELDLLEVKIITYHSPYIFLDDHFEEIIQVNSSIDSLIHYTYDSNILDSYPLELNETILFPNITLATNPTNIALLISGYNIDFTQKLSAISIFDRAGNKMAQQYFYDTEIVHLDFIDPDHLIILGDNSLGDVSDTIERPINIQLRDINLNLVAEKNYGIPFIQPVHIQSLSDNSFGVLGTRLKSIDLVNGKEPDQIYFIKKAISDISTVGLASLNNKTFSINPNPSEGMFTLNYQIENVNEASLIVYDMSGKLILQKTLSSVEESVEIDLNKYSDGMYICQLITNIGTLSKKIVKQ